MSLYRTSSKIALSVGVGYRYLNDAKFHEFKEICFLFLSSPRFKVEEKTIILPIL
jgi:hypothetical protein